MKAITFKAIMKWLILGVALLHQVWFISAEVFTAVSDIEDLLVSHKTVIDDLESYVKLEENRLKLLKKHIKLYKKEHVEAMQDIANYLANPINAFTLIKRLTTDLDNIEDVIYKGKDHIQNLTLNHADLKYPNIEDLQGAAEALIRLQDTYKLDVAELAEGKLNGVIYSTPMTAGDCYELGRTLYNQKDYKNCLAWMTQALRKYYTEKNNDYRFGEPDIFEYIAFSYYLMGDVKSALHWTNKLLERDPDHPRAKGNIPHYEKRLAEDENKNKRRGDTGDDEPVDKKMSRAYVPNDERLSYESLCRGEMDIPIEVAKNLDCRYMTENHPFLKLAPIKVEQVYIKPDIYVFHQVISNDEIEQVKSMAKPRFKRAVVHDSATGELIPAQYRISKSAWLRDNEDEVVAKISQRVADMTGLDMESAEELQVVNYGIGGHYEPHFDFARNREVAFSNFPGNRIATVLFYMSEVAQGGATVFTELGLSVFPIKNAAVFWLNLHPSGEGDLATRHAACPVLRGSKWVSNKWLHQGGQELIKPCSLEYQAESIVRQIPKPVPKVFR